LLAFSAGSRQEVYVSHVESPSQFWVQQASVVHEIEKLGTELETVFTNTAAPEEPYMEPGALCAARLVHTGSRIFFILTPTLLVHGPC